MSAQIAPTQVAIPPGIELLYVDAAIVVANKPSGLLVHRGWDSDEDVAMFRVRDAIGAWVQPVHRLDRGTSGVLVLARSKEVAQILGAAFEAGEVEKEYLALVRGEPPDSGVIDYPVRKGEDSERGPKVDAMTHYQRILRSPIDRCSLVLATPKTGRLHQIRRHMRHISHPLLGDVNYGSGETNRHYRSNYGLYRLALHASSITFEHPVTHIPLTVQAPIPSELGKIFTALGLPLGLPLDPSS